MMKNMRNGINSAGMQFVLVAIIITFVFWGVGGTGNNNSTMATINGHRITDTKLNVEARFIKSLYGAGVGDDDDSLRLQVLESMIREEILIQEATSLGLSVSEAEITQAIKDFPCVGQLSVPERLFGPDKPKGDDALNFGQPCTPIFQDEEGSYAQKVYENWLSRFAGINDQKFSERMERELLVSKLFETVARTVKVSPLQIEERFVEENTRVGISFVEVDLDGIKASIEIPDADLQAFVDASLASIQTAYDNELASRFTKEASADTSTIVLLTNQEGIDPEATRAQLEAVRTELATLQGEDLQTAFASKASEISDDLSKSEGGARGVLNPEALGLDASEVIFATEPGELTPVIQTTSGFELVLVHAVTQEEVTPFEDVKNTLADELLRAENATAKIEEVANQLKDSWVEAGELDLELLEPYDFVVQVDPQVDLASRSVVNLGPASELVAALRDAEPNTVLPRLFEFGTSKVIVKIDTIENADLAELSSKKSGIEMTLLNKAINDTLNSWQASLRSEAVVKNYLAASAQ
jgi:peptidyl-prolyl cis-trans isomerase D